MVPMAIAALLGGGLGLMKGMKNEERMDANDKYRKAAIEFSPWTGMGDPGAQQLPGMFESALGGASTGAMMGSMVGGGEAAAAAGGGEGALMGSGAEAAGKLEALKFTPDQMANPTQQIGGMTQGSGMPLEMGAGKYSLMGSQPGSAGALGANLGMSQENPLMKYSMMGQPRR